MESFLHRFRSEPLSSVIFVMDYIQLDFNGLRLTLYVWPKITTAGKPPLSEGDSGYRDALCEFIAHEVTEVSESSTDGLVLIFDNGTIQVNPSAAELVGPEIAMGQAGPPDQAWMVWQPGVAPFEALA
jgi:hypothetical protein